MPSAWLPRPVQLPCYLACLLRAACPADHRFCRSMPPLLAGSLPHNHLTFCTDIHPLCPYSIHPPPSFPSLLFPQPQAACWGSIAQVTNKHAILPFPCLKSVCPQRNLRYRPPGGSLGLREKQWWRKRDRGVGYRQWGWMSVQKFKFKGLWGKLPASSGGRLRQTGRVAGQVAQRGHAR